MANIEEFKVEVFGGRVYGKKWAPETASKKSPLILLHDSLGSVDLWRDVWLSPEFANWSLQLSIGRVRCPVLAIHGEEDEYGSSAFPKFISENVGGQAMMLLLKNCGHMPHKENTQEVISAVKAFLGNSVYLNA